LSKTLLKHRNLFKNTLKILSHGDEPKKEPSSIACNSYTIPNLHVTSKLPKDSFPEMQITKRFKSFRSPLLDVYGLSEQVFSRKRRT